MISLYRLSGLAFLFCLGCHAPSSQAQVPLDSTTLTATVVADQLDTPWEILWGPDQQLWFTERRGTVNRLNPLTGTLKVVATINEVDEQGEAGLMGMAFHPDFNQTDSAFIYLVYTYNAPPLTEKLVRFTYTGDTLSQPVVLLDHIPASTNHVGSRLLVTQDRKLIMTTGDALNTSLAQDTASLAGKILRLNLDGSIPADNPYPNSVVASIGHRNAQGLVQSPEGIIYSSEHGPANDDELNLVSFGQNYGWPDVQGFCNTPEEQRYCATHNIREPLYAWTPTLAVAGLEYYHHPAIPEWRHSLLLVNLKEKDLRILHLDSAGTAITHTATYLDEVYGRLRDVCVAPDGSIYLATSNRDGRNFFPHPQDDRIIKLENAAYIGLHTPGLRLPQKVYPNPVEDRLFVEAAQATGLRIFNSTGALVQSLPFRSSLNVDHLAPGPYIIEVLSTGGFTSRQVFYKR